AELICEHGYSATTNAQIGERAGFSRNMVRDRYGSKDEVLRDLIARTFESMLPVAPRAASGRERAVQLVDLVRRLALAEPEVQCALNIVTFEGAATAHPLAGVARSAITPFFDAIAAAMAEGVEDGSISPDVDIRTEVVLLRMCVVGYGFLDVAGLSSRSHAEHIEELCSDFAARLAPDPAGPRTPS
ncbi:MAG TPA: TetR/AcrR family transcriptional regulator, partial [Aquihabitans sp.]|nr:TetR/AcrR family transcriptional regulator [Aquihabitans sp.]